MAEQAMGGAAAMHPQLSLVLVNWTAGVPDDWGYLVDRALAAEEAGIDRVVVSDHVVFGEDLEAYGKPERGGIEGGRQPTGPDGCWLEPMTSLAVIAGATTRVRLCTGILLAALRRPAVLAKIGGHPRRAVGRAPRPRRRHRLAARGVRGRRARVRRSGTAVGPHARSVRAAVAGARAPRTSPTSSPSTGST